MRSMVHRAFEQVQSRGKISLFRSYHPDYADGEQKRDFVYVKDCADVVVELLKREDCGGLMNVGTGKARSWVDLANAVFLACGNSKPEIEFIDMPESMREQYQYFTEANMVTLQSKLAFTTTMTDLEGGTRDYIQNYLMGDSHFVTSSNI
jgi:ADP-L-glycero-D-manno-heptose 6-epimerase